MRMMVAFAKGMELRFLGHLDLMRTMQRALRRSGLPIKYSSGFNPHIRLSFAAPLSVGVAGENEMMEVPLEDGVTAEEFCEKMNAVLPPCLRVTKARPVADAFPTLMSLVAGSRYRIRLPREAAPAVSRFADFMALPAYVADRRTKSGEKPCDIRPFVKEGQLRETDEGYEILLITVTNAGGALKPALWLQCLCDFAGVAPADGLIIREEILAKDKRGELLPMEEYANE